MKITIPDFSLVVIAGSSRSDTAAFARKHFLPVEIVSADDARSRLEQRQLAVIDVAAMEAVDRVQLVKLARTHHAPTCAIVLDAATGSADKDGFRSVFELRSVEDIDTALVERTRLQADQRHQFGPFDIIGDVHGCADELEGLLTKLGYGVAFEGAGDERAALTTAPCGRRVVFVGDLVDRGPRSPDVLRIVMAMAASGQALCVPGNHDVKFLRWLKGRQVKLTHGLDRTVAQFESESASFKVEVAAFIESLVSHAWLEEGRLAIAHAGIKEEMIGRSSGAVREFCLYGENTGEHDEFGLPVRYHWAAGYRGATTIVYGHTPVPDAEWVNNTLCVDTGCVFGGKLTALRWPEREIVSVPAARIYCEPIRPMGHPPVRPGVVTGI